MMLSLEKLCGVPSLVAILNHPHVKKEIFSFPINETNVEERNAALQKAVAEVLKDLDRVLDRFTPKHFTLLIGVEMVKWAEHLKTCFNFSFKFSRNFINSSFFTPKGLIDEEKAARELLKKSRLSTFLKYKIASEYFLEDVVPLFWEVLRKRYPNFKKMMKKHKHRTPMIMWSDYLEEKNLCSKLKRRVLTRKFKTNVFSYGLKEKNLAAIKFSIGSEGKSRDAKPEAKIVKGLVYKSFCDYVSSILEDFTFKQLSTNSFLSKEFIANRNIILYFISCMKKSELKNFFLRFDYSYTLLRLFLLWPCQVRFMDVSYIVYEIFDVKKYNKLMAQIIFLCDDKYLCQSYNYRLLLKEFWIKSPPHLKQQTIKLESDDLYNYFHLITILFELKNFTADDLANVNLILESAKLFDKVKILLRQGIKICKHLILTNGNFKLADLFLRNLNLNQIALQAFKRYFVFHSFRDIMKKQNIHLFDEIFEWVVGREDVDDFKEEIFNVLTVAHKDHLFVKLDEEIPFSFLNKILRWFQKTDEDIQEWKATLGYTPFNEYDEPEWLDQILKYDGFSQKELLVFKKTVLLNMLPLTARYFLNSANVRECSYINIYFLCRFQRKNAIKFIDRLRSFYKDSIKKKMCLLCLNNNFVNGGEGTVLHCQHHGINGFISHNKIGRICSSFLRRIDHFHKSKNWKFPNRNQNNFSQMLY